MIKIEVGHSVSRIVGEIPDETAALISAMCSFEVQGAQYMKHVKSGHWDGRRKLYHRGHKTFPTGLLVRVMNMLHGAGLEPLIADSRTQAPKIEYPETPSEWALRDDYQTPALETALREQRGMIRMATGGGKTVLAGHIIKGVSTKTVFLVHTKDLLYQALDTFNSMFGRHYTGQIGDGVVEPSPSGVTVCTLQTAARALDVKYENDSYGDGDDAWSDKDTANEYNIGLIRQTLQEAGMLIMDECHRVAAPTAMSVMESVENAYHRFGLSASPWRDDGADIALEGAFGHIIVEIDASTLIDMGHLVPPFIRFVDVPPMRFPKGTKYPTIYEQYIVKNDVRNDLGVHRAQLMLDRGVPTMVLVRQIAHGDAIANRLGLPFLSGVDKSEHRNSVLNDIRAGNLRGLVATTIADEGLDIKPLAGLVLLGGGKSSVRALQRVGRVLRPYEGKTQAYVYDFNDNAKLLYDHSQARRAMYETEERFVVL